MVYTIIPVSTVYIALSTSHYILDIYEGGSYYLQKIMKHRGEIPNLLTCSIFNSILVTRCIFNLLTCYFNGELLSDENEVTQLIEKCMIGYFLYDLSYMIMSNKNYYLMVIIHHHVSLLILILNIMYHGYTNNLLSNSVIIILETSGTLTNVSKFAKHVSKDSNLTCNIIQTNKIVYFITRVIMLNSWITTAVILKYDGTAVTNVVVLCLFCLYIGSISWFFKMHSIKKQVV